MKNYSIIDSVPFLKKHRILLTVDEESIKFGELIDELNDFLEGDLDYDEFYSSLQNTFLKLKPYFNQE